MISTQKYFFVSFGLKLTSNVDKYGWKPTKMSKKTIVFFSFATSNVIKKNGLQARSNYVTIF